MFWFKFVFPITEASVPSLLVLDNFLNTSKGIAKHRLDVVCLQQNFLSLFHEAISRNVKWVTHKPKNNFNMKSQAKKVVAQEIPILWTA